VEYIAALALIVVLAVVVLLVPLVAEARRRQARSLPDDRKTSPLLLRVGKSDARTH
jgi:hypothetical protein